VQNVRVVVKCCCQPQAPHLCNIPTKHQDANLEASLPLDRETSGSPNWVLGRDMNSTTHELAVVYNMLRGFNDRNYHHSPHSTEGRSGAAIDYAAKMYPPATTKHQ
jgi:hypothetical protein